MRAMAQREQDVLLDQFLESLASRPRPAQRRTLNVRQCVEPVAGHSRQKRVLVGEVVIGRGSGDTRSAGNCAQGHAVGIRFRHKFERCRYESTAQVAVMLSN